MGGPAVSSPSLAAHITQPGLARFLPEDYGDPTHHVRGRFAPGSPLDGSSDRSDPRMTRSSGRLGRRPRAAFAVLAAGVLGVLATARVLKPDPRGFGTHAQLGLGECAFRGLTGWPCPSCGMTTAFSWAVRGRLDMAWRANPAGSVIVPCLVFIVPWSLAASITGRTWPFRTAEGPLVGGVLAGVALALASWVVRLLWLLR